jgi:hypothetical protein
MITQNLDKLEDRIKAIISWSMQRLYAYDFGVPMLPYMIEVKLDNPLAHLLNGGDMVSHRGNGSKCYAKHSGDPEWAIIHFEDEDFQLFLTDEWVDRGREVLREFMPNIDEWERDNK